MKQKKADDPRLPVTLLSGFLGSGKTTLMRRILENRAGLKVAVIVNDMAELNIDAALLSQGGSAALPRATEDHADCPVGICFFLKTPDQVTELAAEGKYDLLVIESTGISEPMQVAETFAFPIPAHDLPEETRTRLLQLLPQVFKPHDPTTCLTCPSQQLDTSSAAGPKRRGSRRDRDDEDSSRAEGSKADNSSADDGVGNNNQDSRLLLAEMRLSDWVRLDTCVTVVDGSVFDNNLHSIEELKERYGAEQVPEGDMRTISNLLLDQIEFADVILLNKVDLLTDDGYKRASRRSHLLLSKGQRRQGGYKKSTGRKLMAHEAITLDGNSCSSRASRLKAMLQELNPKAIVIPCLRCEVDLEQVLLTGRFDMQKAAEAPGWLSMLKELSPPATETDNGKARAHQLSNLLKSVKPETEEYGISSCVYRARRPFHPLRLFKTLIKPCFYTRVTQGAPSESGPDQEEEEEENSSDESGSDSDHSAASAESDEEQPMNRGGSSTAASHEPDESQDVRLQAVPHELLAGQRALLINRQHRKTGCLLRSKGFVWLPSSPNKVIEWSSSGVLLELATTHPWFCTVPKDEWPEDPDVQAQIRADFSTDNEEIGDRRQELVFIGQYVSCANPVLLYVAAGSGHWGHHQDIGQLSFDGRGDGGWQDPVGVVS
eukprot:gene12907-13033_t